MRSPVKKTSTKKTPGKVPAKKTAAVKVTRAKLTEAQKAAKAVRDKARRAAKKAEATPSQTPEQAVAIIPPKPEERPPEPDTVAPDPKPDQPPDQAGATPEPDGPDDLKEAEELLKKLEEMPTPLTEQELVKRAREMAQYREYDLMRHVAATPGPIPLADFRAFGMTVYDEEGALIEAIKNLVKNDLLLESVDGDGVPMIAASNKCLNAVDRIQRHAGRKPGAPEQVALELDRIIEQQAAYEKRVKDEKIAEAEAEAERKRLAGERKDAQKKLDEAREQQDFLDRTRGENLPRDRRNKLPPEWNPDDHWHTTLTEQDVRDLRSIAIEEKDTQIWFALVGKKQERSFLLSGPAGWGKSFLCESEFRRLGVRFLQVNSRLSPIEFFELCWNHRHGDVVIVIDDGENLIDNAPGIDIVKQACGRGGSRWLNWSTRAAPTIQFDPMDLTAEEDARFRTFDGNFPKGNKIKLKRFIFNGYIVIIVNAEMRKFAEANPKLRVRSLLDCTNYSEIRLRSPKHRMLRIASVVARQGMLWKLGLSYQEEKQVMEWMWTNYTRFWQLTLRSLEKTANLRIQPDTCDDWQRLAMHEFNFPEDETKGATGEAAAGQATAAQVKKRHRRRGGRRRMKRS